MSLHDDIEYLKARLFALEDRVKTSPHFRWGTVAQSVPLTIILDGAADALPGTPANAGPKVLMVGERVRVELQGNRAVVHAAGGRYEDLRGTTAQRVALALSGAAVEGMRFYDETEDLAYIWRNGTFQGDTDWVRLDGWNNGFAHSSAPVYYRRRNGYVEFIGSLTNSGGAGLWQSTGVAMPAGFRPTQSSIQAIAHNAAANRAVDINGNTGVIMLFTSTASTAWWSFDMVRYPTS